MMMTFWIGVRFTASAACAENPSDATGARLLVHLDARQRTSGITINYNNKLSTNLAAAPETPIDTWPVMPCFRSS